MDVHTSPQPEPESFLWSADELLVPDLETAQRYNRQRRRQANRLAEKARNDAEARAIENFRANVLPALFPQVKEKWRYKGYSTNELWVEPRGLIDHPRLFAYGRKRNQFVLVSMPYDHVPERRTAIAFDWWCQSPDKQVKQKMGLRVRELPSGMSWHLPGHTKLLLLWPENGIQPDFMGLGT